MPPKNAPRYWMRVVARGVGCAVKNLVFPKLKEVKCGKTTVVSAGRELPAPTNLRDAVPQWT